MHGNQPSEGRDRLIATAKLDQAMAEQLMRATQLKQSGDVSGISGCLMDSRIRRGRQGGSSPHRTSRVVPDR
jgi:hypothetical protein